MDLLLSLWLPILLSAAAVWIVSTIFGMPFLHHKNDWIGLGSADEDVSSAAREDAFMQFLRQSGIKPGNYLFPDFRSPAAMKSEKVSQALEAGPVGHLSLWPPPLSMGGKLAGTFIVYLVASTLIAYLASVTLPLPPQADPGAPGFARVFQVVGTAGVLAYSFSFIPSAIWFGAYKRAIVASIVDGIAYGVITGAIFAWRWPH
ncbi:hypothetical protein RAS1_36450 [Phycisphaerae bacterium RAS1]|nr:hypothetical protein RAS1_36450 [Phycisphaerae bacterium RAS1]